MVVEVEDVGVVVVFVEEEVGWVGCFVVGDVEDVDIYC